MSEGRNGVQILDASQVTSGVFPVSRGGTGLSSIAQGGILYAAVANVLSRLAPSAGNQALRSTAADALQMAILLAADIPSLAASKITSGQFPVDRMPRAASGFLRGKGVGVNPAFEALIAGDIPNLAASKITSLRFPVDRLPAMTDEKIWKGTGANVEEVDIPAATPTAIGSYSGNDTVNRAIAHGLGVTPKLVVIIDANGFECIINGGLAKIQGGRNDSSNCLAVTIPDATNFYVGNATSYAFSANDSVQGVWYWAAIG